LLLKLFVQVCNCALLGKIRALLGKIRAANVKLFLYCLGIAIVVPVRYHGDKQGYQGKNYAGCKNFGQVKPVPNCRICGFPFLQKVTGNKTKNPSAFAKGLFISNH